MFFGLDVPHGPSDCFDDGRSQQSVFECAVDAGWGFEQGFVVGRDAEPRSGWIGDDVRVRDAVALGGAVDECPVPCAEPLDIFGGVLREVGPRVLNLLASCGIEVAEQLLGGGAVKPVGPAGLVIARCAVWLSWGGRYFVGEHFDGLNRLL